MVAATRSTTQISNVESNVRTFNASNQYYGKKRSIVGTFETAAADAAGSVYALCKVQPNWVVTSIKFFNDAIANSDDVNVGLYTGPNSANLTDADENCYADDIDWTSASLVGVEAAFEARDIVKMGQKVYEDAGDSLGDFDDYYLCATMVSDVSAAGTVSFVVEVIVE
jgi:hypothetical protein